MPPTLFVLVFWLKLWLQNIGPLVIGCWSEYCSLWLKQKDIDGCMQMMQLVGRLLGLVRASLVFASSEREHMNEFALTWPLNRQVNLQQEPYSIEEKKMIIFIGFSCSFCCYFSHLILTLNSKHLVSVDSYQ
jgi:hypothetical protein